MKITFYSNYLNHHQLPFCLEMYGYYGDNFKFVATEEMEQERLQMGYVDISNKYPFTINAYENSEQYDLAMRLGIESDVVIFGSSPRDFIIERRRADKLLLFYNERLFKKGYIQKLNFKMILSLILNHTRFRKNNHYLLAASAFATRDFNSVGAYINKSYKWGYFPEFIEYDFNKLLEKKRRNKVANIIWVGRFIDWKHPLDVIELANRLNMGNYKFQLDIIGTGTLEDKMTEKIADYNLEDVVHILGKMSPEQVRAHMEKSNIFIFSSDFNEGWGAVLNEAMNSGCAVISSHAVGATAFLVEDNINGLIYESGNINHLEECTVELLNNPEMTELLGKQAYQSIKNTWNVKEATKRLIHLIENLLKNKDTSY